MGLVSDHAYAVISVHEIDTDQGPVKLLRMFNPWGHKEWLGDWSDTSDLWTPKLKKELGMKDEDDGIFFISHEDYMNYFLSTVICKVHADYQFNSVKTFHNRGEYSVIRVKITEETKSFFTVSQLN